MYTYIYICLYYISIYMFIHEGRHMKKMICHDFLFDKEHHMLFHLISLYPFEVKDRISIRQGMAWSSRRGICFI